MHFLTEKQHVERARRQDDGLFIEVNWETRLRQMRKDFEHVRDSVPVFEGLDQFFDDWEYMFEKFGQSVNWNGLTEIRFRPGID